MSIKSGLPFRSLPIVLGNQPNGAWAQNPNVYTTLDKGTYLLSWNPRLLPALGGADTFNSQQFAVTSNAAFGAIGSTILASSPKTGVNGQGGGNAVSYNLNNIIYISTDATPIYLYINATTVNLGGWIMNTNTSLKYLVPVFFTRL